LLETKDSESLQRFLKHQISAHPQGFQLCGGLPLKEIANCRAWQTLDLSL